MKENHYFNIILFCGIWYQGIIGTFAEVNFKESSKLLDRNKRLVSSVPEAITKLRIDQVRYVVQIQRNNNNFCVGNILLAQVILTAAHCLDQPGTYHVLSGSVRTDQGTNHRIIKSLRHPEYQASGFVNDLLLLYIDPHIDIVHSPNRPIIMNQGFVPPNTLGLVSGWGCIGEGRNGMVYPQELRSIVTHTISQERCNRIHKNQKHSAYSITDRNICTEDKVSMNRCSSGDSGAPLVISNRLVGIMAWNRDHGDPDVFMNLAHPAYREWIIRNLPPNPLYKISAESSHTVSHVREPCVKKSWTTCFHLT